MPGIEMVELPASLPVTLDEARAHCRLTSSETAEDGLIGIYLQAATATLETDARISLVTQTRRLWLDGFPRRGEGCRAGEIRLWYPPVQQVLAVTYLDTAGVERELDPARYRLDAASTPPRVLPAHGYTWPETLAAANSAWVDYVAGSEPASVSPTARAAILLLVAHLFEDRSAVTSGTIITETPLGYDRLMNLLRVPSLD
ncbi:MAG TPA: phage head-tail connector protein [Longimicrobium sp.]|nr:phage head-tail connector protein [Longimicrobium sp.]